MGMFTPARNPVTTDLGLLLIRGMVGWIFVYHGSQKLFSWFGGKGMGGITESIRGMNLPYLEPELFAQLAAWSEFGGGILLIIGLFARIAVVPLAITMAIAVIKVHWVNGFALSKGGIEFALLLGVLCIGLLFTGPGRISFDGLFFGRFGRPRPRPLPEFEDRRGHGHGGRAPA